MNTKYYALVKWATWNELHNQPNVWDHWEKHFDARALRTWVSDLDIEEVWFCGAGTSAFIGDIIVAGLEGQAGPRLRSVATTDLVSRPQAYLKGRADRLMIVSFGRSGNSSESIGTLSALDALRPQVARLHFTCNGDGALAKSTSGGPQKIVVLPDSTHDSGFAMTSSFSTMLLSALSVFDSKPEDQPRLSTLAQQLRTLLPVFAQSVHIAPQRIVFLGTGALKFAARESALKVMELSAGQIPALWESVLGFRHGPKSFVNHSTAVFVYLSPDHPTSAYEADLVIELKQQFPEIRVTTIGPGGDIDFLMPFGPTWSAPLCIAMAQVIGVIWSDALGMNVDSPFDGQETLSRVVSDVTLYPVTV